MIRSALLPGLGRDRPRCDPPASGEARQIEVRCRQIADRILEPHHELLERADASEAAWATRKFMNKINGSGWIEAATTALMNRLGDWTESLDSVDEPEDKQARGDIRDALALLELADELAALDTELG